MNETKSFDNYPLQTVFISNALSILIYISGLIIMSQLGWFFAILYISYILFIEFRQIKNGCTSCYYWGKMCAFGRGAISAKFFKKGFVLEFCSREMTWKDMIPDLLIPAIPFLVGIILIISDFDFGILFLMIVLALLSTKGNEYVRGKLACSYCKQRELGCPAFEMFNKK